ncbi:uncharacterized protein LOC123300763 [Chrysoperla carnea]|uniref:uncharacterized protein LOC123300763 n=1 Tax=Chrysoperla carnea TaxID=189513 RepID=UPI001D061B1B|nr:uncharacterized protein LOC123300763 [Chrysoperla carnea]
MASHTSLDAQVCSCGCCKPRRRRMQRSRRRRSRSPYRRRRSCSRPRRRSPCPTRRRSIRRRSRRRVKYCKPGVCVVCGQSPCAKSCSCGCNKCRCVECNKAAITPSDCNTSSNAFMNFLSAYKRKCGCNRNIVNIAAEAGRIWNDMSDEEREEYNYKSPSDDIQITVGVSPEFNDGIVGLAGEDNVVELGYRPGNRDEIDPSIHDESSNEPDNVQRA